MLPDFPGMKEKLQKFHLYIMGKLNATYMGAFSDIPRSRIFEGNKLVMVREDDSIEETEFAEMKAKIEVDMREVEDMTPDAILRKYADAVKELTRQQTEHFYGQLDSTARKVGNVFDAGGKPFSIEHLFETLERIHIDFDKDEKPEMPIMVFGQGISKSVFEVMSHSQTDPKCEKRFKELMERKKEEWRVREANRKLVG